MWNDNAIEMFKLLFQKVLSSKKKNLFAKHLSFMFSLIDVLRGKNIKRALKVDVRMTERHRYKQIDLH